MWHHKKMNMRDVNFCFPHAFGVEVAECTLIVRAKLRGMRPLRPMWQHGAHQPLLPKGVFQMAWPSRLVSTTNLNIYYVTNTIIFVSIFIELLSI